MTHASLNVREERPDDIDAIDHVLQRAFAGHPHSRQTEHLIVRELRRAGALAVPKVAVLTALIVGYATFSLVQLGSGHEGWFGLGPVAVDPAFQCLGIGTALVLSGLEELKNKGAAGCVVLGDPRFYRRFGFVREPGLTFEGAPAEFFLARAFAGPVPAAPVSYHRSFASTG